MRISCVLGKCPDLVCLRPGVAERAWNEANPCDDAPTLPQNEVPAVRSLDAVDEFFQNAYAGSCLWLMTEEEFDARKTLLAPSTEFRQAMFGRGDEELPTAIDVELPEDWSEV